MSLELDEYLKSGCILEARNPDELASFSNKIFMKEVRIFCPLWFDCVRGASGLSRNASKECGPEINSLALATATLARLRNVTASVVHYRISTIMFHRAVTKSGTGTWDRDVGLGTRGRGTRGHAGTRGRDKQTTPNICAEFVEYNFRWSHESYFMLESLLVVADGFQRPWFGRTFLLAYLTVRTLGTE